MRQHLMIFVVESVSAKPEIQRGFGWRKDVWIGRLEESFYPLGMGNAFFAIAADGAGL
jgi:hypothetical protein